VAALKFPVIPMRVDDEASRTFKYEGFDVITLQKEIEREYALPQPQTAQEVIGYYARRIAEQVKLPSQFAALAPKVREFFEARAFGRKVDLEEAAVVRAMATPLAHFVTVKTFSKILAASAIGEREPTLLEPERRLSACRPFPWSQLVYEARKTVFNLVPCDNEFERAFARFLDGADDVVAFAKLPMAFGFSIEYVDDAKNLRFYYPDFVAVGAAGVRYLLETKGAETAEVQHKDRAATLWCENATALTGTKWMYRKVLQREFERLAPRCLGDLEALDA